jgi:CheY-like chemotaxis protein
LKIFIVDDDPTARLVAIDQLSLPDYELREFDSGAALLAAMDEAPDLILLDVTMPGMDGIAACRALREAGHDQTQVMFVSARDDLETRLAAYISGGNDFIIKPYAPAELEQKVRVAELCMARRKDLAQQAQFAQQTAFTAMSSMAEMGVILEFLRASFACADATSLGQTVFAALRQYGLEGILELRLHDARLTLSSRGESSPLEASILAHTAKMERIFQFHNRLAINYPNITLLILTLPIDDPDRVGRLRDHLAILAEGADARLQAMATGQRQRVQASGIGHALTELTEALAETERSQMHYRQRAMEIDEAFLTDLVAAFVHLGLTDGQEATLADMAQRAHIELNALRNQDDAIGEQLRAIARRLKKLAEI